MQLAPAVLIVSAGFSAIACQPTVDITPAQRLAGAWTSALDGSEAHLDADGHWTWTGMTPAGPADTAGHFSATWTRITFTCDDDCPCGGEAGRYGYDLALDTILLTVQRDDCPHRVALMSEAWTRVLRPAIASE